MEYIQHHGIKGQQWGVRRFQNRDGSLTEAGKKRYYEIISADKEHDIIKKGSMFDRLANTGESLDSRRKYVSLTENDKHTYGEMFDMIGIDMSRPISEYVYSANRDLKIVSGQKVVSDVLNKYGDEKIRDIFEKHNSEIQKYGDDYIYDRPVNNFIKNVMDNHGNELISEYKKQKYDGMVDIEDYVNLLAEYPVILLNPQNSVSLIEETKWSDKYK